VPGGGRRGSRHAAGRSRAPERPARFSAPRENELTAPPALGSRGGSSAPERLSPFGTWRTVPARKRHGSAEPPSERRTDAADPGLELIEGPEWPRRVAFGDDTSGEGGADAGKGLELRGRGDVHVERRGTRPGGGGLRGERGPGEGGRPRRRPHRIGIPLRSSYSGLASPRPTAHCPLPSPHRVHRPDLALERRDILGGGRRNGVRREQTRARAEDDD
jgi:hypothetical protein